MNWWLYSKIVEYVWNQEKIIFCYRENDLTLNKNSSLWNWNEITVWQWIKILMLHLSGSGIALTSWAQPLQPLPMFQPLGPSGRHCATYSNLTWQPAAIIRPSKWERCQWKDFTTLHNHACIEKPQQRKRKPAGRAIALCHSNAKSSSSLMGTQRLKATWSSNDIRVAEN